MKTGTTRPKTFDARSARLWLLAAALGLSGGASLRLFALPAQTVQPVTAVTPEAPGVLLLRGSALRPVARTRGS